MEETTCKFGPLTLDVWYRTECPKFMRLFDPPAPNVRHETWSIGNIINCSTWGEAVVAAVEAGLLPFTGPDKVREWYEAMPKHERRHVDIRPMMSVQGRIRLVPSYERDLIYERRLPGVFDDRPGADYDAWLRRIEDYREQQQTDLAAAADEYEAEIIASQYMGWLA